MPYNLTHDEAGMPMCGTIVPSVREKQCRVVQRWKNPIPSSRHVHHKNQVKTDDRPCNLLSVDGSRIKSFAKNFNCMLDGNPSIDLLRGKWSGIVEQAKNYNHAIVSIEKLPPEPVYNFTVDRLHNYPLSCGVISSNCITGAIGIGKSSISIIGVLYDLYRVTLLKNPHKKYKLLPTTPIVITLITATMDLAGPFSQTSNRCYRASLIFF